MKQLSGLGGKTVVEELSSAVNIAPISNLYLDKQIVEPITTVIIDTFGHISVTLFIEVNKATTITLAEVSQDGIRWRRVEEVITEFEIEGSKFVNLDDVVTTKAVLLYRFLKVRINACEPVLVTLELASKLMGTVIDTIPTLREIRDFLYTLVSERRARGRREVAVPGEADIYPDIFVYPHDGVEKIFPAGKTKIDFYDGTILFADDTIGWFVTWLKKVNLNFATCLFIESDKTLNVQIENMGWQEVVADTYFLETRVPFKKVYLETTEAATISIWASPNPDAILLKLKKSLFQILNQGAWTHDHKNVTVAGTAEQLDSISIPNGFQFLIKAKDTNSGRIYLGNSQANAQDSSRRFTLWSNESKRFGITNANLIWIDAEVSGEGIEYSVELE